VIAIRGSVLMKVKMDGPTALTRALWYVYVRGAEQHRKARYEITWKVSSSIPSYIKPTLLVNRMNAITQPASTILLVWTYNLGDVSFVLLMNGGEDWYYPKMAKSWDGRQWWAFFMKQSKRMVIP
jgi:hypothetical protein